MKRAHRKLGFTLAIFVVAGCNAILDNRDGTLASSEVNATNPPETEAGPDTSAPFIPEDAAPQDAAVDDAMPPCPSGTQRCDGVCVSANDPAYGCGSATCKPCSSAHATAACQGGACVVAACEAGYADCNAQPNDGCEKDLSKSTSCGGCNVACPSAAPFCTPGEGTFHCANGCPPTAPLLCGTECVDPTTTVNHCGSCPVACPAPPNGTAACTAATCSFLCAPAFHACGNACVPKTSPTACGPTCVVCPVPPNAVATCVADACGMTCKGMSADCDGNPANGCEADTKDDPQHCGDCTTVCPSNKCKNGKCEPAKDD